MLENIMLTLFALFSVLFGVGTVWLAVRAKRIARDRHSTELDFTLTEDRGGEVAVTQSPSWEDVEAALAHLAPDTTISLVADDGTELLASGARARFTIRLLKSQNPSEQVVGRQPGGRRRGRVELSGDLVLFTTLEFWDTADGALVFRAFFKGENLADRFALRDPAIRPSPKEIAHLLRSDSP